MWGLQPVLVHGPSMAPTLRHGDAVLARRGGRPVRPGDIVLGRFLSRPDLLVVKRAVRPASSGADSGVGSDTGWWLEGDNPLVTDDSRAYGFAQVEARVLLRYWPHPRRL
jgi:signal peptidase I